MNVFVGEMAGWDTGKSRDLRLKLAFLLLDQWRIQLTLSSSA